MFRLIRSDGTTETFPERPTIERLCQLLACTSLDVVSIGKANRPPDDEIMLVDDTGAVERKPVNAEATRLYQRGARPGWAIHGDVIVTYDRYFEEG
jgi:hypothetical protein